ncbi:NAD(P)-dependent oxidoreductase [Hydrogenimonas thermophila]|uniref:NAD-dependent epimerase/dehydratase family protein n=1 Tax=Hydrogenimonas thermophila TaxID=223786 RepID=UPI002936FD4D|nr:NAD(P)-dependent oxidoreductase [Hydrogenimonas thermophila]WOE70037.1 NAD(P)-dependent oxidoreductase [Hydrogenimonas thermophila]WOE72554.1 NAD(P)-dependent oxidoreductase [Hydrogenimonas thermophila]
MKILVTGATGFIGQNLVKSLVENQDVYAIVRENSELSKIDSRVNIFRYNGNINTLIEFFQKEKFDGIVHLASLFLASHKPQDIPSLIDSNVKFGTELLECAKLSNVKWFINTGTFWQNYQDEDYNPVNLYAATKEAFEKIAKYYTETSNIIFTTIKLNDTFGPNDTRNKIFNLWQKISKSGETLDMSKGEQIIDISYIEDVVSAYEILINHLNSSSANEFKNKTFAVRSNERVNLKQLATIFEEATGYKLNINWGAREYREREVMHPWSNGVLIPGWKPKYSLKEAIKNTIFGDK